MNASPVMPCLHEFTIESCRTEMIRIVQQIFQTMLRTEAETTSGKPSLEPNRLTAQVHFQGAWHGTLSVQCSTNGAKQLARLFAGGQSCDEFDFAECQDVIGELANIVAGNLKVMLPKGTQASYPETIEAAIVPAAEEEVSIQIQTFIPANRDSVSLTLAVRN